MMKSAPSDNKRKKQNLRDSTNRQNASPKPFRLFSTEPAHFGFEWKTLSLFKHLKIWPTESFATDLSPTQMLKKPEVVVAKRTV
jgi:hypothetical protein